MDWLQQAAADCLTERSLCLPLSTEEGQAGVGAAIPAFFVSQQCTNW